MMQTPLPPDFEPWDAQQPELQKPKRRLKPGVKTALLTLVLFCAVLVILYEGVFKIRRIAVVGNEKISWEQVVQAAGLDGSASFFSLSEEKISAGISQNRYLVFEGMEKEFPSGVTIYVRERKARANVQVMGITYLLDEDGMVLERLGSGALEDSLLTVTGFQAKEVRVGNIIVPATADHLAAYQALLEELTLQNVLSQTAELNLADPDSLYLITRDGYTVHLGDDSQLRAKIGTVRAVISKLREMGKYGGVIEASVPAVATYTPVEM